MFSEKGSDRLSFLFDLAASPPDADRPPLSPEDGAVVEEISTLLDQIDAAWQAHPDQLERIRILFLEKLAATDPDHPWVAGSTVHTVGELVRAGTEEIPPLPGEVLTILSEDATPVEALLDPASRTSALGRILRAAGVPQNLLGELLVWFNRTLSSLTAHPGQPGLLYTRRQSSHRDQKETLSSRE